MVGQVVGMTLNQSELWSTRGQPKAFGFALELLTLGTSDDLGESTCISPRDYCSLINPTREDQRTMPRQLSICATNECMVG